MGTRATWTYVRISYEKSKKMVSYLSSVFLVFQITRNEDLYTKNISEPNFEKQVGIYTGKDAYLNMS